MSYTAPQYVDTKEQAVLALAQYVTGGGGGGDFTTATVTLNRAEGFAGALQLDCACVAAEEGLPESTNISVYSEDASYEFTAVLYKGKCLAYPTNEAVTVTATGDATYDSDTESYIITGDCTLTFADA